jgi:hypothetical protein
VIDDHPEVQDFVSVVEPIEVDVLRQVGLEALYLGVAARCLFLK